MNCFSFLNGDKKDDERTPKWVSAQSTASIFTDSDVRRVGSELTSRNLSEISTESLGRTAFPNVLQKSSNLKAFTVSELKSVTKNFSRSVMIGEGGFGSVYKGTIKITEDPSKKLEVAVKQLNRKGTQGHKEWALCFVPPFSAALQHLETWASPSTSERWQQKTPLLSTKCCTHPSRRSTQW